MTSSERSVIDCARRAAWAAHMGRSLDDETPTMPFKEADAAMRILLTDLRKQILDCALVGEYVPGAPEISSFGPEGGAYNEAIHVCYDIVESLLKEFELGV